MTVKDHSFPTGQIALLLICRTVEPIAFTSVTPYIFSMLRDIDPTSSDNKIENYAAWAFSAYSLSQALSNLVWGRIGDVYGRRVAILGGFLGTLLATVTLAFSTNVGMIIVSRVMAGALSGNIALVRTMLSEMTHGRENQARAFSYNAISYQIGYSIGPALGGMLANPCQFAPGICRRGPGQLLRHFPYALPNIIIAASTAIAIVFAYLYLEETRHAPDKDTNDDDQDNIKATEEEPLLANQATEDSKTTLAAIIGRLKIKSLPTPTVQAIIAYLIMALHTICFDNFFPMFLSTSLPKQRPRDLIHFSGGPGMSTSETGMAMSASAVFSIFVISVVFSPVVMRLGTLTAMRLNIWLYPFAYFFIPYLVFTRSGPDSGKGYTWGGIAIILFLKTFAAAFTFTGAPILVQNAQRDKSNLGLVNGIAQTAAAAARAVGPLLMGLMGTVGERYGIGGLGFWFLTFVAAIGVGHGYLMSEPYGDS
ncbi:hypothetical protein LTR10_013036 [Elasticomyces elasticus]|uniref:Major facilitator superfamily (MFS) profile domain-containing protein n=1 Tax=Exophiala sideris TaxID=1016849 RepID=A0ABR0JB19_9EURO|nr:hypothetical protein LTR10_013036 [Elasticomyces elasticus]KAK5030412.1 hypothetical protein LTS07_005196 [Exophiala sideris]KAK5038465.1 hypothetical protein LTR13_004212 [Exophiala sideris]KAK5060348.1 hypothetical protein LTR69_005665 [Exophiala sideris]KAK5183258.1 hypothetical protein LTR44_004259 [Eurotiomycetes sp. CCFEE 6388]